jgi:CRISPR/Cas system CSM-associated protein Csm4 (group 5 of RAMP superfamily)
VHIKSILRHASILNHVRCTPHLFVFQGNPILLPHLGIRDIDCSRNHQGSQKKVKTSKFQLMPHCSNYHSSWSAFAHLQKNLEEKTIVSKQCSVGKKEKRKSCLSPKNSIIGASHQKPQDLVWLTLVWKHSETFGWHKWM